jgi:5-methylcytosine-specific restriction enzyme A
MTLRPCLDCGQPCTGPRCTQHTTEAKGTREARGYDAAWRRLSKRARRLQPFCIDCDTTEDLQADHTTEAWERYEAGRPIRLQDIAIRCGPCNRAAGAARGPSATRGRAPSEGRQPPVASRDRRYTRRRCA